MITVTLKPTTKRLKQLIREHGSTWVMREARAVACFADEVGLFIQSPNGMHTRWVRLGDVDKGD